MVVPSILSADFACLGSDIKRVISAGAQMIHFDVMDNHYVPNLSFGPMVLQSLKDYGITVSIDVHLMARPIDNLILDFINIGVHCINIHPESTDHIDRSLQLIHDHGCKVGLVLNPSTSLNCLKYIINRLDVLLLMSVNPGFSGQSFLPIILDKIRDARSLIDEKGYNIILGVDGGININNICDIVSAGANRLVVGSAIFNSFDCQKELRRMTELLCSVF